MDCYLGLEAIEELKSALETVGYKAAPDCVAAKRPAPAEDISASIERALREDAGSVLHRIADLAPLGRVKGEIPMVRGEFGAWYLLRAADDAVFRSRLCCAAPFLAGFDLKAHGLCLAGEAAGGLLMKTGFLRSFDLFPVGHESVASVLAAVKALADHLRREWRDHAAVHCAQDCVTFTDTSSPVMNTVRAPLRRYASAAEVLRGFDIGAEAALWDGERVLVTGLGRFAFERGAVVLNLAARRAGYEQRLADAFLSGYDLVLPDLGESAPAEGKALPYLGPGRRVPGAGPPPE